MAKNSTSFMNERSLEYVIIPELIKILSASGNSVAPIFYWKSREGGAQSACAHNGKNVRVVALFARRPKINKNPNIIDGKINWQLINFAKEAKKFGIPSVAAFCAGRSLFELTPSRTHWIELRGKSTRNDIHFSLQDHGGVTSLVCDDGTLISTIDRANMAQSITAASEIMSFATAMHIMDTLRHFLTNNPHHSNFLFSYSYKPVYLLIEEAL